MAKKSSKTAQAECPETPRAMIDRRAARSRRALQQALRVLIVSRGYDAITVKEICVRARVSRATFYAHFQSKADLKRRSMLELKQTLGLEASKRGAPFGFSRALFTHAEAHRDQHKALAGSRGGQIAHEALCDVVTHLTREDLRRRGKPATPMAVAYYTGSLLGLLRHGLDSGTHRAEEMEQIFRSLVA